MWLSHWWASVPNWAQPVVLASAFTVAWGVVQAIPKFARGINKSWKWLLNRKDSRILRVMEEGDHSTRLANPTINLALLPYRIEDLANAKELNWSVKSAYKSLRRLEALGRVYEVRNGEWSVGDQTRKHILTGHTAHRWGSSFV
jgi:hypothetical protein